MIVMEYITMARGVLKKVIPWSEEELTSKLNDDYKKLEEEKNELIFSLEKVEKELILTLDNHEKKEQFIKAKVIINKDFNCHVDMYFYFESEDKWEKSTLNFNQKIVLNRDNEEKLKKSPPLEIDFTL